MKKTLFVRLLVALQFLAGMIIPAMALAYPAQRDTLPMRYLKLKSVGDRFSIVTKEPIRFYFENFDESDSYFCLLPTSTPGVFNVELRAGSKELTDLYAQSVNDLKAKNLELQTTINNILALNPTAGAVAGTGTDYSVKPTEKQTETNAAAEKLGLEKQQGLVNYKLKSLNDEYTSNESHIKELRGKITDLVAQNGDPKQIKDMTDEMNSLTERNKWLSEQRSALLEEKNRLQREVDLLVMKAKINDLEIEKQRLIIIGLSAFAVLLLVLCYVIFRSYKQKKRLSELLSIKNSELIKEQEVSNALLLNILPPSIAGRLKGGETSVIDYFTKATVIFIDIASFTKLSASVSPQQLLAMLNEIFSELDGLTEKYGMEKIKTIGDAYMVVSGIPTPREDHAAIAAAMALDVRNAFTKFKNPLGGPLHARIGIATGEAIAGIIGKKKFIYDLWGDSVNTASRMESTGVIGQIQCTEEFYKEVGPAYKFTKRGEIEVKGKGHMTTYFLDEAVKSNTNGALHN